MEKNELNEMIEFLFNNKITTHIDSYDGTFYNGLVIEKHETFLVINDRVLGLTPISLSQIKTICKFKGKNTINGGEN